jgi:long-chain-fatty-acid--[acyl-carrier-protein] ligase
MLPASSGAGILYLAVLFAGKVPVMVNWTVGVGNVRHGLELTGTTCVITARALFQKLAGQGIDLAGVDADWLFMEDIAAKINLKAKIRAAVTARIGAGVLKMAHVPETAAILFTSGSESRPKAVPLSHANIIANMKDFTSIVSFMGNHRLLGMLPPFHSLGLVGTIILPLCLGLKTVYHANPTESGMLAGLIESYRVSILIGTPTFLGGIIKAAAGKQLQSLRLVFTGAEKCPEHVYQSLKRINAAATLCEGYGITECSPLVSINRIENVRQGTIGSIMPSMEYAIIDQESSIRAGVDRQGLLLVRGPNIFNGYYPGGNGAGFTEFEGKRWYNTGDFVKEDADGILTFCGRKKRFVKLGGEMISLPAIENVLLGHFTGHGDNGPTLAVEATPTDERPEIVLFTTLGITREEANDWIRKAGLSPLHNIRIVQKIEDIPVLGTGKTDYKLLQKMIAA